MVAVLARSERCLSEYVHTALLVQDTAICQRSFLMQAGCWHASCESLSSVHRLHAACNKGACYSAEPDQVAPGDSLHSLESTQQECLASCPGQATPPAANAVSQRTCMTEGQMCAFNLHTRARVAEACLVCRLKAQICASGIHVRWPAASAAAGVQNAKLETTRQAEASSDACCQAHRGSLVLRAALPRGSHADEDACNLLAACSSWPILLNIVHSSSCGLQAPALYTR